MNRFQPNPAADIADAESALREIIAASSKLSRGVEYNEKEFSTGILVDHFPIITRALRSMQTQARDTLRMAEA